jgi:SSS family solute:Na+ symporter
VSVDLNVHVGTIDVAVIVIYLAAMLAIGAFLARRTVTVDSFLLAGRAMTTPILICTLVSTFYGVDVLFGTSELGYTEGIVAWFSYSRPTYLFLVIAALALAPRLRSDEYRTLPDVLDRHYGRSTQIVGALASFVYALPSLGLFGLGRAFSVVLGWEPWVGALLFGGIALLYTLCGGLLADVITDTVQFVMMCVTLAIALPIVMGRVGGFETLQHALDPSYFQPLGTIPLWLAIVYALTGLVVFVEPAFYQRIFAARSARDVRNALLFGTLLWAAYDWCVTAAGMFAAGAVQKGLLVGGFHANEALLRVVVYALPVGLTGVFLAGVLAAEMSTIDSYCLVAGGNLAYDIYRPLFRPAASERELLRWTRISIVAAWACGFVVAFSFERLLALWVFMSTILTATVMVPTMAALFWRGRKTSLAGFLSSLIGLSSAAAYYVIVYAFGEANEEFGTYIWRLELHGRSISLWQEYALLFSLPLSSVGFVVGNLTGKGKDL